MTQLFNCRFCHSSESTTLVNLGKTPLANAYLKKADIEQEKQFPLQVEVCHQCGLTQLPLLESPDQIFSDYAYFSSFSESWLNHAKEFVELVTDKLSLDTVSYTHLTLPTKRKV